MRKTIADRLRDFESLKHLDRDGVEYWSARELLAHFGYSSWEKFLNAINRSLVSVKRTGIKRSLVFRRVVKHYNSKNRFGEFTREKDDYHITRYGCYVLAQNGDPSKEAIAAAQAYFAIQTRRQEISAERLEIEERLSARQKLAQTEKEFAAELFQREVDGKGLAVIRSKGDQALFGGQTTDDMKKKMAVPINRPLADFLPTVTIKAKDLAAEITTHNTKRKDLRGVTPIGSEHQKNNEEVRKVLVERGIKPETLPPAGDIKRLRSQIKKEDRLLPPAHGSK